MTTPIPRAQGEGRRSTKKQTWAKRIAAADRRGGLFAADDYGPAGSWPSCAVSEYPVPTVPGSRWEPADPRLRNLGNKFFMAVYDDNVPDARRLHAAIARRAAKVLKAPR